MDQKHEQPRHELLSLRQIAAWQLPELVDNDPKKPPIMAGLPSLQRGAVWKPHQVECLWDSLARGFPIGSFLLAPFSDKRGQQPLKFQQSATPKPKYHLLDGQQRANAIALGFLDPWSARVSDPSIPVPSVLWVDIAPPNAGDLRFIFRVLTTSHPWGYGRDNAANRISSRKMLEAMERFCIASPDLQEKRPSEIPLRCAWPYDAVAPVPLSLLLQALGEDDPIASLREKIKQVPLWKTPECKDFSWAQKVHAAFDDCDRLADSLRKLCLALSGALKDCTPALALRAETEQNGLATGPDPVETLFIRVNTSGKKLDPEEQIYSLLKSAWPEAQQCVEKLQFRMIPAPRVVLLATRLALAALERESDGMSLPPTPDVARFRKLLDKDGFIEKMRQLMGGGDSANIFKDAENLLKGDEFRLPALLACGIARTRPDILFLLLRWIDKMRIAKIDPYLDLDETARRRILGTVTALAWFAIDPTQCVGVLWRQLQSCPDNKLKDFFSPSVFRSTLALREHDSICMLPLVPPESLADFIAKQVDGRKNWSWGERMQPEVLPRSLSK